MRRRKPAITMRPDEKIENADWSKRTRDVDATGKPVARRTSKRRKQGGK